MFKAIVIQALLRGACAADGQRAVFCGHVDFLRRDTRHVRAHDETVALLLNINGRRQLGVAQLGGQLDSVVVAKFTVEFAARSGRIEWLFPDALLDPIRDALAGDGGIAPVRRQEPWAPTLTSALQDTQMNTRAVLAQAQISLRQLVSLSPGDIIPIEAPQQVTLFAGDVPLYRGRFGISQGRNALKILPGAPV